MPAVEIRDGALQVGDERVPVFSGEMHYWRLSPARWGEILDRYRALGLNIVSTYVPWEYHELSPGVFDFRGQTEPPRDLAGFVELVTRKGLWLFIRPGPFIYAEWRNAGVPDRIVPLPRISEPYRCEAAVWMAAVTEVLRPHLATSGGRIILWQADNEMDLFSHWFEDECGLSGKQAGTLRRETAEGGGSTPEGGGSTPGGGCATLFEQFLRTIYADIAALNAAWGTSYEQFEEATAFAEKTDPFSLAARCRQKDYWRFQHWATAEALRWHVEEYRRLGVDVPIIANYYAGGDVQNWRVLSASSGADLLGIDWYPRNEFAGDAGEHRRFLDTCRYQRAVSAIPMVAELECGVWHGFHEYVGALTPNHYRLMAVSALMAGIQGWNWYMLVDRDNWYYSPVNERGELRGELAEVFVEIHRVVRELDPPSLRKLTRTAAYIDPVHMATDGLMRENAVLRALYEADVDVEVVDDGNLGVPSSEFRVPSSGLRFAISDFRSPGSAGVLFYAAADWLSRAAQRRLSEYVSGGGTLVVFRDFPQRDENFAPHNGLTIEPPARVLSPLGKKLEIEFGNERAIAEGAVWNWDRTPGEPIWGMQVAGRQQVIFNADVWMTNYIGRRWICGYRERRGAGSLIVIGMPVNAAIVRAVQRWLGVPRYAHAEIAGVKTALFERGGEYFLLATNLNAGAVQTRVRNEGVDLPARFRVRDLWTGAESRTEEGGVVVNLAGRSGGAWRIVGR